MISFRQTMKTCCCTLQTRRTRIGLWKMFDKDWIYWKRVSTTKLNSHFYSNKTIHRDRVVFEKEAETKKIVAIALAVTASYFYRLHVCQVWAHFCEAASILGNKMEWNKINWLGMNWSVVCNCAQLTNIEESNVYYTLISLALCVDTVHC